MINDIYVNALFDTGSRESFIQTDIMKKANLERFPAEWTIAMASASYLSTITRYCVVDRVSRMEIWKSKGERLAEYALVCASLILGLDFQAKHTSVTFEYGGYETLLLFVIWRP